MRLRLKEDPREWRKFAWALSGFLGLSTGLWAWRYPAAGLQVIILGALAHGVLVTGTLRPRMVRPVYRVAMTGAHYVGQFVGRVLLTAVFFTLLTPLGLIMRFLGNDPLHLRRSQPHVEGEERSYWRSTRPPGPLDRMY